MGEPDAATVADAERAVERQRGGGARLPGVIGAVVVGAERTAEQRAGRRVDLHVGGADRRAGLEKRLRRRAGLLLEEDQAALEAVPFDRLAGGHAVGVEDFLNAFAVETWRTLGGNAIVAAFEDGHAHDATADFLRRHIGAGEEIAFVPVEAGDTCRRLAQVAERDVPADEAGKLRLDFGLREQRDPFEDKARELELGAGGIVAGDFIGYPGQRNRGQFRHFDRWRVDVQDRPGVRPEGLRRLRPGVGRTNRQNGERQAARPPGARRLVGDWLIGSMRIRQRRSSGIGRG